SAWPSPLTSAPRQPRIRTGPCAALLGCTGVRAKETSHGCGAGSEQCRSTALKRYPGPCLGSCLTGASRSRARRSSSACANWPTRAWCGTRRTRPECRSSGADSPRSGRPLLRFEQVALARVRTRAGRLARVPFSALVSDDGDSYENWAKQQQEELGQEARQAGLAVKSAPRGSWRAVLSLAAVAVGVVI